MKSPWQSWFSGESSDDDMKKSATPPAEQRAFSHEDSPIGRDVLASEGDDTATFTADEHPTVEVDQLERTLEGRPKPSESNQGHAEGPRITADRAGRVYYAGRDINETHYHPSLARTRAIRFGEISDVSERFIIPVGGAEGVNVFARASQHLEATSLVVLVGAEGSGRYTSALMMLNGFAMARQSNGNVGRHRYQKIIPDWDTPDPQQLPTVADHCYILDISEDLADRPSGELRKDETESDFFSALPWLAGELRARNSALVILITENVWRRCEEEIGAFAFGIGAPSTRGLVERFVDVKASEARLQWLEHPQIRDRIKQSEPPAGAVRIARIICESANIESALAALDSWHNTLLEWFRENSQVERRTSLIAAATLGASEAVAIRRASDLLLAKVQTSGAPSQPACLLAGDGLTQQMFNIGAVKTPAGYDIAAGKPSYAEAIIDHVWDEYAGIRKNLIDWLFEIVVDREAGASPEKVAAVGTGIAIRHGNHGFLPYVAKLARSGDPKLFNLAATMLDETVLHPVVGVKVRASLLEWAVSDDLQLVQLTAIACGSRLGLERTHQAMTRLSKILSRSDRQAQASARKSLIKLFNVEELRLGVVETILGWITGRIPKGRVSAGARVEYEAAGAVGIVAVASGAQTSLFFSSLQGSPAIEAELSECLIRLARHPELASSLINSWLDAIDDGQLEAEFAERVIAPLLTDQLRTTVTHRVLSIGGRPGGIRPRILRAVFDGLSASREVVGMDEKDHLREEALSEG